MEYLKIRNWEKYQHYKREHPAWIKLHSSLLTDYEFGRLSDGAWRLGVSLMLLASKTGNRIPKDMYWIRNQCGMERTPDVQPLLDIGFVEIECDPRGILEQSYNDPRAALGTKTETETETETEERRTPPTPPRGDGYSSGFILAWAAYPHFGDRSRKREAWGLWRKLGLEPKAASVLAWASYVATTEGQREGGQYVPGFHRWLKGRSFDEDPPQTEADELALKWGVEL